MQGILPDFSLVPKIYRRDAHVKEYEIDGFKLTPVSEPVTTDTYNWAKAMQPNKLDKQALR